MKRLFMVLLFVMLSATYAFATPVYNGATGAAFGVGGIPDLPTSTGYYVWSNNDIRTSWSVRWTGNNNNGTVDDETWIGSVDYISNDLDTYDSVLWETSGYYKDGDITHVDGVIAEYLTFAGHAGPHFDGFDFTINNNPDGGRLRFNLGGSYFADLILNDTDAGIAATGMWVGGGNVVNVNVGTFNDETKFQSFETPAPVPEPGTLLLLGAGLIGLAFLKRRKEA